MTNNRISDGIASAFDIRIAKFILVGLLNGIIGVGGMFLLYNGIGIGYWLASGISYFVASAFSFFANRYYTFENHGGGLIRHALLFIANIAFCYFASFWMARISASAFLGGRYNQYVQDNVAMLFGMCLFTGMNYIGQRYIVFSHSKS